MQIIENDLSEVDFKEICSVVECAPTAILIISLIHALYGVLQPEPDYFGRKNVDYTRSGVEQVDIFPNLEEEYINNLVNKETSGTATNTFDRKIKSSYDFIVVGGGTAGCVIASRLTETTKAKVLLIEAGSEQPKLTIIPGIVNEFYKSNLDWKFNMRPDSRYCQNYESEGCPIIQGRVMGGTSSINHMIYTRGSPYDYNDWAKMGTYDWDFGAVLPYFKYSEGNYDDEVANNTRAHGKTGPLNVGKYVYKDNNVDIMIEAMNEIGYTEVKDFNGFDQIGTSIVQTMSYLGERTSTNSAFIEPIRKFRPNLEIVTEAMVTRIDTKVRNQTLYATGVTFLKDGIKYNIHAKKEVIITAGTINSAALLMRSGIGPAAHLEFLDIPIIANLPVGENFHDHLSVCLPIIKLSKTSTTTNFINKMYHVVEYYRNNTGILAANHQVMTLVTTPFSTTPGAADVALLFRGNDGKVYYDKMDVCVILLTPESRGIVMLNTTDPFWGKPSIFANFLKEPDDRGKLLYGIREVMKLFKTEAFKLNGIMLEPHTLLNDECNLEEVASDIFWECNIKYFSEPLQNFVGTVKMGSSKDKRSVVDYLLKVHGFANLRVADASVMPKIPRGYTAATTIMIAEKAADKIKIAWY